MMDEMFLLQKELVWMTWGGEDTQWLKRCICLREAIALAHFK